jgi:hypothetical protein
MKTFKIAFISLLALTVFFGTKDLTVENVLKAGVDKGWGVINLLFGGNINASNNRPLPQGQGDDSESQITPIENLEEIK